MEQNKIVTYYVIKDLATWTTRGCKQSVCERYEHAEEAMQQLGSMSIMSWMIKKLMRKKCRSRKQHRLLKRRNGRSKSRQNHCWMVCLEKKAAMRQT